MNDGDLELSGSTVTAGRIRLDDGDLDMDDCGGSFDVRVRDGDVRVEGHRGGTFEFEGADGDVEIELVPGDPLDLDVRLQDGDLRLEVDDAIDASFSLSTTDGDVDVDHPRAAGVDTHRGEATGTLGAGGGKIRVRAGDGDITLRRR